MKRKFFGGCRAKRPARGRATADNQIKQQQHPTGLGHHLEYLEAASEVIEMDNK